MGCGELHGACGPHRRGSQPVLVCGHRAPEDIRQEDNILEPFRRAARASHAVGPCLPHVQAATNGFQRPSPVPIVARGAQARMRTRRLREWSGLDGRVRRALIRGWRTAAAVLMLSESEQGPEALNSPLPLSSRPTGPMRDLGHIPHDTLATECAAQQERPADKTLETTAAGCTSPGFSWKAMWEGDPVQPESKSESTQHVLTNLT